MVGSRKAVYSVLLMLLCSGLGGVFIANSAFGQTLSIAISSPSSGATFTTGQTVTITATVSDGGNPVSGATVTANSPTGATIALTPTSTAGTYTVNYGPLGTTTPSGTWTITVTASSGGMTASAQAAVFIMSGSLTVTFLSPTSGTLYNVGETATIKAIVVHLDSTAIPSSSAVTFTKPNGLTAAMATDPTDPSGRTWVAVYAIMSTDALPQGFDWPITITATAGTSTGFAIQHVSLFNSLLVATSTFSNSAYTTPQNAFTAGQTIFVKAAVTLHDGTQISSGSGSAIFEISGTSVSSSPTGMTYSPSLAAWTGSYLILPTDQIGAQFVTASASDTQGNTGSGIHVISLATGSSQGLSVFIAAPAASTIFNRGETTSIAALVTLNGAPVSGATVIANTPTGATIALGNTAGGMYSGQYTILTTDPIGTWTMVVSAMMNGQTATSEVALTISNSLNVAVSTYATNAYTTPQDTFVVGQTVFVKAAVTLHDGTQVSLGGGTFLISGTNVASVPAVLTYSSLVGAWTGSYTVLPTDATGSQAVTASAFDMHGNAGSGTHAIVLTAASQNLAVFINTPISSTVFNRGETVSLTALVTLNGSPVSGATVTATTPTGAIIALANTAGGTYASQYTVLSTDPAGTWNLVVLAGLSGLSVSTQEPLTISNSLRVTVATYSSSSYSTPQSSFSAGQAVFVKAQVTLQDGTAVASGTATFVITGTSISATPMALVYSTLNAWTGSYTVLQSDQSGNQALTTTATDFTGNTGSGSITVMIGVTTPSPTPLEAGITFNSTTHDIQVNAICGAGCVAPTTVTQTSTAPASASQNDDGHGDGQGNGHGNGHDHGHQGDDDNGGYVNSTYTIADSGGHVVTLVIQTQSHGHEVKASIVSIQYGNASPVTPTDNKLDFQYSLAENGSINSLNENVGAGNSTGQAHFDAKDGMTTITIGSGGNGDGEGDDDNGGDGGQNTITNTGLWLLELTTSNGTLSLSYFQSA